METGGGRRRFDDRHRGPLARPSAGCHPHAPPLLAQHRLAEAQSLVRGRGGSLSAGPRRGDVGGMRRRTVLASLAAGLGGCAPMVQGALIPQAGFGGPSFSGDRFTSFDGACLGLTTWAAEGEYADNPWAVIIG